MRLQFCSDLHLNSHPVGVGYEFETILEPNAKALVICGDLGDPETMLVRDFFAWAHNRWESIFWIPGFQEIGEAWSSIAAYQERIAFLKKLVEPYPTIYVCVRERFFTEDGMLLLATPFWTRIPDKEVHQSMPTLNEQHLADFEWLRREIFVSQLPVVVATYMPPSYQMMDPFHKMPLHKVFWAADTEILLRPPVVGWITGYIHKALIMDRAWQEPTGEDKHIAVVSNARGYQGEETGYRADAVLRVGRV